MQHDKEKIKGIIDYEIGECNADFKNKLAFAMEVYAENRMLDLLESVAGRGIEVYIEMNGDIWWSEFNDGSEAKGRRKSIANGVGVKTLLTHLYPQPS